MEKVKYRYNRWRLALGRLVNLRYINRWIIFCADLFISLCVSLIGVLGLLSIMHVYCLFLIYLDTFFVYKRNQ